MAWRIAVATGLAAPVSGCGTFYVGAIGIQDALTPEPVSVVTVTFARDAGVCAAMVGGDASHQVVQGALDRIYTQASAKKPAEAVTADWKRIDDTPSFVILAGTHDGARNYYDFNNDGTAELVYALSVPPDFRTAYVALPADDTARAWLEAQQGHLPADWRARVADHGGHVVELTAADVAAIRQPKGLGNTETPALAVHVHAGASYVMRLEERIGPQETARLPHPFRQPPLSFGSASRDEGAYPTAEIRTLYSVNPDYSLTRACTFLEQTLTLRYASS